ncbi:MAG: hypothetical protein QOG64_3191, partial [Acidimicrobiaceae bacterium]|nr:hypothetical protein [Acidimicrobiaceae bacterium]
MGRRRHWPAVLAAMALVGFVLAVPVRVTLAKAEFLRLQQRWTRAEALTTAYATALDRLRRQATAEDADAVARITRTLDREQAAALRELRSAVVAEHTPDAAVARLRR